MTISFLDPETKWSQTAFNLQCGTQPFFLSGPLSLGSSPHPPNSAPTLAHLRTLTAYAHKSVQELGAGVLTPRANESQQKL